MAVALQYARAPLPTSLAPLTLQVPLALLVLLARHRLCPRPARPQW